MTKEQKEVQQAILNREKKTLRELEKNYKEALDTINNKIELLMARDDNNMQYVIYQVEYQNALKEQVTSILELLKNNNFETVSEYLTQSYKDGFVGTMYDLQAQGIPLILPINQKEVVKAIQHKTKLSKSLYSALDTNKLSKQIASEISRGLTAALTYNMIALNIANYATINKNNAMRIARTEAHRISNQATFDAQQKAKEHGADIVKQWDAALDGRTRKTHRELDGTILELNEKFKLGRYKASFPGDFNVPSLDINCRCALLQRARWALDKEELKQLRARAAFHGLDKTKSFNEYRKKYLKISDLLDEYSNTIAGVKQGKAMTFEEADTFRVNPNYRKLGYKQNCQTCVAVFEVRQRGYNVIAKPYLNNAYMQELARQTNKIWIDPNTGKAPEYITDRDNFYSARTFLKYLEEVIEQDKRYTLEFDWKRGRSGHIVNVDRDKYGKLRITDNQIDEKYSKEIEPHILTDKADIMSLLKRIKYYARTPYTKEKMSRTPKILRIDNMQINKEFANEIMEGMKE